jgi:hypothetical protein
MPELSARRQFAESVQRVLRCFSYRPESTVLGTSSLSTGLKTVG